MDESKDAKRKNTNRYVPPKTFYAIVALGALLRFFRLGFHSLWLDEFINVFDATHSFREIPRTILASPPLYHYCVRCFYLLFGKNDFWLRFPSALYGAISIPFIFYIVDHLFSRRTAIWAALLYAVSPMSIVYSQELRMYSLVPLLSLGILYFWELSMRNDQPRDWFLYVLFSLAGLYTHNWFPFLIASTAAWSFAEWGLKEQFSFKGIAAIFSTAIFYLPWVPVLLEQMRKPVYGHMAAPKLINLAGTFYAFSGARVPSGHSWVGVGTDAIVPLMIISTILFLFGLRTKPVFRIAVAGLFLPLLSTYLISRWYRPIFMANRYTIMFLPTYFIVVSQAFRFSNAAKLRRICFFCGIAWVCCCLFVIKKYYFNYQKAPWKTMVQWMNKNASPDDRINLSNLDYNSMAFNYYVPKLQALPDLKDFRQDSLVFIPARNADMQRVTQDLPLGMNVQMRKDFGDYSVLVMKRT